MKNIKKYTVGVLSALCLAATSCNVLDIDPSGTYSDKTAYASLDNLDLYVKNFYGVLYANANIYCSSSCLMDDGATDLIKYSWYNVSAGSMNKFFYQPNFVTEQSNFRSNWSSMYNWISKLNEYLEDLSNGLIKLDPEQVKIRTAEVRFLRAFAYQELVIRHGGVVLRNSDTAVDGPNERAKARSSESDCWDFIIGEYKKAEADLPDVWEADEAGRLTKGAAWGMIARASLYAERWSDAVTACDEVLKKNYTLLPGQTADEYYKIFSTPNNSELIIPVYFQSGISMKQHNFNTYFCPPYDGAPYGMGDKVGASATPTDEYASSFDIKVGDKYEAFSWDNLSKYGNKPFDNREPRFYASILYNDATWLGRKLELYAGGKDGYMDFAITGQDNVHKTTTGYIFRKFLDNSGKVNFTNILAGTYWTEMRLAEIYLIRSEAYARQNDFGKAYADLKTIRDRVGLPELTQKGNWDDYLQDLAKERICELGLEGHRYFDLIRWDIAVETLDHKRLHGVKVTKTADGFSYERVECDTQDRLFPEKYTIFPIPYSELQNNTLCEQNEIWK